MNNAFLNTIYLFSCGAKGIEPTTDCYSLDYKEIYNISKAQGVWETVFLSFIKINNKYPNIIPKDIFDRLNTEFIVNCDIQYRRYDFIHKLLKKLMTAILNIVY